MTISKLAIETAEKVLLEALNKKRNNIATKAFEADIAKYKPALQALNLKALKLFQEARKLQIQVEKNKKLELDIEDYNSFYKDLPKTLAEAKEPGKEIVKAKNHTYYGNSSLNNIQLPDYSPDYSKAEEKINEFILNLKLGQGVMGDMNIILAEIAKL